MSRLQVRSPQTPEDQTWLARLWREEWGGETMVSRGHIYHLEALTPLIAWDGPHRVGLATFYIAGDACEIMSLNATASGKGVGSTLLAAVEETARQAACQRVWLITSNDNVDALRFYQRRGYRLTAIHLNAIDQARKLKPTIPQVGNHGIPLHDEWELTKLL